MAPRPYWKGYLKLSLVSCAVSLFPAVSTSGRTSFHTLNRQTGNRVKRQYIDAETEEVVATEDQVRGYEVAKGEHVIIEDEDLESVRLESTHTIDIESFVERSSVDQRYLDQPYYIAPDDRIAQEAFAVIRDAMDKRKLAGLGRVVMQRRERIVMLEPRGKGIVATSLHYADEVRDEAAYFEDIEDVTVSGEMLDLATHIMKTKAATFDPSRFKDRYEDALVEMVRAKQTGATVKVTAPQRPSNVVNLLDALRRSLANDPKAQPEPAAKSKPAKARAAAKSSHTAEKKSAATSRSPKKAGSARRAS